MTGQELKERIRTRGMSELEIARRLDMSQQGFNRIMRIDDVKTSLLEKLCKVFDVDMSFFYPLDYSSENNNISNIPTQNADISDLIKQNAILTESIKTLTSIIEQMQK